MSGVQHKDKVPLDYMHGADVVGYADTFDVDNGGLTIGGFITPFKADDRGSEILAKAKAGVPWEGSVNFAGGNLKIQKLKEGQYAQVNGYLMQGPATIFREWTLRGAAVCPYGADSDTQAQFAAGSEEVQVEIVEGPLAEVDSCQLSVVSPAATPQPASGSQPAPTCGHAAPAAATNLAAPAVVPVTAAPAVPLSPAAPAVPLSPAAPTAAPVVSPVPAETASARFNFQAAIADLKTKASQFTEAEELVRLQYDLQNFTWLLDWIESDSARLIGECVASSTELDTETAELAGKCAAECREISALLMKVADACDAVSEGEPEGSVLEQGAGTVLPESSIGSQAQPTAVPQPDNPPAQQPASAVIASIPAKGPVTDPPPGAPLTPPAPPATTQSAPPGAKQFRSWALGSPYWVCEPGKEPWECVMRGTAPDGRNLLVTKPGDQPMATHYVSQDWLSATKPVPASSLTTDNRQPTTPSPDGKAYIAAFGEIRGDKWFTEGLSFEQAKDQFIAELSAENATLSKRLAAVGGGEETPVSFQPTEPDRPGAANPAMTQLAQNQGDNIARIAAGIAAMSPGVFRSVR